MNRLHQNQSGYLGTFELYIDDTGDSLTLATAGGTHQTVSLSTGDLIWLDGRTDASENGPYKYDGTGFVRPTLQESLRSGADIARGAEFIAALGDNAGRRFRVTTVGGGKDGYGVRHAKIGTDDINATVTGEQGTPRQLEVGVSSEITGSINGTNTDFVINTADLTDVYIISVVKNDNTVDLDNAGGEGDPNGDYTYDDGTQTISFHQPPQTGDEIVITCMAIDVA